MQTITELVKMAGDCTYNPHYGSAETFCPSSNGDPVRDRNGRGPAPRSPNFEVIDGLLYRKKLERGFINYREVLKEDRRHEAVSTFHRRRSGPRHLSFEETYKCVAENYWWDGMYHHIRSHVLGCPECQRTQKPQRGGGSVTMTMASHGAEVLRRLQFQREAGLFCDITLRTEGRSFSAHRAVLAAASEYFQETLGEKEADARADVDLTGFSEQSLLPLLHFSYSSTLRVRPEDLPEVSAMARHLGMWPALEACSALLREQTAPPPAPRGLRTAPSAGAAPQGGARPHRKRERLSSPAAEEPTEDGGPRRVARRRPPGTPPQNGALHSPAHPRMKLIDFKSPSCKKACRPAPSTPPRPRLPPAASPLPSPPHTRLLRSTPGAAQEVLRLLPRPESPRRNKKAPPPPRRRPGPVRVKQEPPEEEEEGEEGGEGGYERAQEKYRLMSVLGLQRTALLPRPQDLVGWRQKKRLRKLKANNYCLTKRRPPRAPGPGPAPARLLKAEPEDRPPACGGGGGALRSSPRRAVSAPVRPPPAPPAAAVFRAIKAEPVDYFITGPPPPPHGRRDDVGPVAREDAAARAPLCNGRRPPAPGARPRHMAARRPPGRTAPPADGSPPGPPAGRPDGLEASGTPTTPAPPPPSLYSHPLYRVIKEEPADPLPVGGAFPEPAPPGPAPPDLGKRRSKPPIKLLDPGFLFSFCRPGGFAAAGPQPRVLRPRGAPPAAPPPLRVKRERVEKSDHQHPLPPGPPRPPQDRLPPGRPRPPPRTPRDTPKTPVRALAGRRCILLGAARPSRLKPRPRPPPGLKDPRAAHCCLTCHTTYRDCLALVMHRLRHVEGKHWPCPLCSKNFFRLRNVRNHIRTHDQTLYKCRSCVAGS
ncbi:unnamed protein product [Gadus morhua 'NCC']